MGITYAIITKSVKDTLKNKEIFIQFVMFPVLTIIMNYAVKIEGMPENLFVNMFAAMYIGMAPLVATAAIIAEEKEKNTLRVLLLSNVRPASYLIGTGGYIGIACLLGSVVFCVVGHFEGTDALFFMGIMALGILISVLLGAAIGTWSKNQMAATSTTVPVMLIFAFLPMLGMFNETFLKLSKLTYTGQLHILLSQNSALRMTSESIIVIACNAVIAATLFVIAYRKSGLLGN